MTTHRFKMLAAILAAAVFVSPGVDAETDPTFAVVEGVVGVVEGAPVSDVSVDGVVRLLQPFERIGFGVVLSPPPGTVVFLNQIWETSQGQCLSWRVLNGVPWRVGSLKRQVDHCPIVNPGMSLTSALTQPGITDISGLIRPVTPLPQPSNGSPGTESASSHGLGDDPLTTRLSRELDSLYQARGQVRPRPAASRPAGVRVVGDATPGADAWQAIPGGGTSAVSDAAVAYRDRLYVFALGIGDRAHYMNVYDGAAWNGWQPVPGGGTSVVGDSAVVYRDQLYLFGIGEGDRGHYMNVYDGARWSGWQAVPGGGTTDVPDAAVVHGDFLYLFSVGIGDRAHYVKVFNGSAWTSWQELPGGGRTRLATTAASYQGRLYLVGVGIDDGAYYVMSSDGPGWSGWSRLGDGTTNRPPLLVADNGVLRLFGIGQNDRRRYVNVFDGARWTGWSAASDRVTNQRDAAASFRGRLYLVGIGADDRRHYYRVFR